MNLELLEKLAKMGVSPIESSGTGLVKYSIPEALQQAHNLPSELTLDLNKLSKPSSPFGKVTIKPEVDRGFGKVIQVPEDKTAAEAIRDLNKDKYIPTEEEINTAKQQIEQKRQAFRDKKVAGIAALPMVQQPTDMNPLNDLKGIFEKYQEAKKGITDAAARQMDLTKDKSASQDISNVLGMAADPMNLVGGAPGAGLAAADILSQLGGKSKIKQKLGQ